ALTGIAFALAALIARRDGGVGAGRPLVGFAFSVLQLIVGAGNLWFSSFAQPSTPWVYQSQDGAYRLTLPSQQWKESRTAEKGPVVVLVRQAIPRMQAAVQTVTRQQTEADFARAATALHDRLESNPQLRGQAAVREGTNAAGNRYHYFTGMDSSRDG